MRAAVVALSDSGRRRQATFNIRFNEREDALKP
jgi:hypothetical protein